MNDHRERRRGPPVRGAHALLLALATVGNAGCSGVQSAWAPEGPVALAVVGLGNVMFVGAALILALVVGLTAFAVLAAPARRGWLAGQRSVFWLGAVFPTVVVTALLVYGLGMMASIGRTATEPALTIEVSGERWWWRVRYLDAAGEPDFVTANEIRMPAGRPVEFRVSSPDVIHSFWIPKLGGKLDMIPGRVNAFRLQADRPGVYRGQCAEFCGLQHALMAFDVVALAPEAFETWRAEQREPARTPATGFVRQGRELFLANGCGSCHVVRGTPAEGALGPDLTHVGSRRTIAAGAFPNNVGTLAGWISSSQHLKPGNLMPSFDALSGVELRAIAAYLDSLE